MDSKKVELVEKYEFFTMPKKILKLMQLWPESTLINMRDKIYFTIKMGFFCWSMIPNTFGLCWDIICILHEGGDEVSEALEPFLGWICLMGHHYLAVCFLAKRSVVNKIIEKLHAMKRYRPMQELIERDQQAMFFTKIMLIYSTMGSAAYTLMPVLPFSIAHCEKTASKSLVENRIPCIMSCRVRFPFLGSLDDRTVFIFYFCVYIHQIFLIFNVTYLFITLTMLLWSIVMQLTHHFRALRSMIEDIDRQNGDRKLLIRCIYYHHAIIDLCNDLNEAFGSQMIMFITLPSVAISVLGFNLMGASFADATRYGMHLVGWICLLFLVSFGGQVLMEESEGVAETAYGIKWYDYDIKLQKDLRMLIRRAQKPERLNALGVGFLNLTTFLKVIYTAYSYFTVLIKMKLKDSD